MSRGASGFLIFWMSSSQGFDLMAWVAPLAVFAAALLGTILLVRRWSAGGTQKQDQVSDPRLDALKKQIRRETEMQGLGNREQGTGRATVEVCKR
jgi:cytochrome c-type biogenesis protein CcmH